MYLSRGWDPAIGRRSLVQFFIRGVVGPKFRTLLVLGYPDIFATADAVPDLLQYEPISFEDFNGELLEDYR